MVTSGATQANGGSRPCAGSPPPLNGQAPVLLVEDDPAIADSVAFNLREEGFQVVVARRGDEALELTRSRSFSLILLDRMLPGVSGDEICSEVRNASRVPILILSARSEDGDKVGALESGADDYVTKPFSMRELVARVKALLRRSASDAESPEEIHRAGGVTVDVARHQVLCDGEPVVLRPKQFELLRILISNRGRVIPRSRLMEQVWGEREHADDGTLEVHIRWLRQRVERDPAHPTRILTVRGVGYQYAEEPE